MTVYLVRHASAGVRDDADPFDKDRPIDADGADQARRICEWLRHEPIESIASSPLRRCLQTVQPLAAALGVEVQTLDSLAEGTSLESAWSALADAAVHHAGDGSAAVLCSHGDLIPELLRRARLRGMHVPGKDGCSKGSVWTLRHWDGNGFLTGVYTPVPR